MTDGVPITLAQLLAARDSRAARQRELLQSGGALVSLTVNMPGPVKRCALADRLFDIGLDAVTQLLGDRLRLCETRRKDTGCEAFLCADMDAQALKARLCALEDGHPLGRLWDADVLGPDGVPLSRQNAGYPPRQCLLCENPGAACARSRAHPLDALTGKMQAMLEQWEAGQAPARRIGNLARRALEKEVRVTPKPGLVDACSNGAHTDMNLDTFLQSAAALEPHFTRFARMGLDSGAQSPRALFDALRVPGQAAERDMYRATGGVNTHKGAIFSLGVLCAAAGRLLAQNEGLTADALCALSADMTRGLCARELPAETETHGGRVYHHYGAHGVRGEVENGFPAVRQAALPVYRACRSDGCGDNEALVRALLRLMTCVEDTNLLARRGRGQAEWVRAQAAALEHSFSLDAVRALDEEMTRRGLSPGGCADLLAVAIFLISLEEEF